MAYNVTTGFGLATWARKQLVVGGLAGTSQSHRGLHNAHLK